jgi:hypothetical protein
MNCQNCGAAVGGDFCTECGSKALSSTPEQFNAPSATKPKSKVRLFSIIVLACLALGTAVFGIGQQTQVTSLSNAESAAFNKVTEFRESVETWSELLADAKSSKDTCYYNYWCSASTYSSWIRLVNLNQDFYDEAVASADEWQSKANIARIARQDVETRRTIGFAASGASAVGVLVAVFVGRRKPVTSVSN